MNLKIILVSGTPGTGKTSVVKKLHELFGYEFLSIGEIVLNYKLFSEEDKERDTKIVDEAKLTRYIEDFLKIKSGSIILESHYSDMIKHPSIFLSVVFRCHPSEIEARLKPRGYNKEKILENIESELLGDSTSFMMEKENLLNEKRIFEIDTTTKNIEEIAEIVHQIIQDPCKNLNYLAGKISWLSDNSVDIIKYLR